MLVRTTEEIGTGDPAIAATVQRMREFIRWAVADPRVGQCAREITQSCASQYDAIRAIREWCGRYLVFTYDPPGEEFVQRADVMLQDVALRGYATGDCDDAAVLTGSLGAALGYRVRIICIGLGVDEHAPLVHTWGEIAPPSEGSVWIECDVTRDAQGLGEIPLSRISRRTISPVCP